MTESPSEVGDHERRKRAKARWMILRSALLGERASSATKEASIHRFDGFQMLSRRKIPQENAEYFSRLKTVLCSFNSKESLLDELETKIRTCCQSCSLWKSPVDEIRIDLHVGSNGTIGAEEIEYLQQGLAKRGIHIKRESLQNQKNHDRDEEPRIWQCIARLEQRISIETPNVLNECVEYTVPLPNARSLRIRARERKQMDAIKVELKALTSHRHYGVDNTGNARVWDSESTLTYCLMNSCWQDTEICSTLGVPSLFALASQPHVLHVVELGAGMAGLAGLALGSASLAGHCQDTEVNVVVTDGHPDAVQNNLVNAKLTMALYPHGHDKDTIRSSRLLWKDSLEGASECAELVSSNGGPFDLCLASDCTHFQEFHAALMLTMARLLKVGGVAVLCQPQRGASLERFVQVLEYVNRKRVSPSWQICLLEDYDESMSRRHKNYLRNDPSYDPSIHYPLLLVLRKLRGMDEETDRDLAVKHMEERDTPPS